MQHLNEDEKHSISKRHKKQKNRLEVVASSPEPRQAMKIVNSSFVHSEINGSIHRSCENSDEKSDKIVPFVPLNTDLGPVNE